MKELLPTSVGTSYKECQQNVSGQLSRFWPLMEGGGGGGEWVQRNLLSFADETLFSETLVA